MHRSNHEDLYKIYLVFSEFSTNLFEFWMFELFFWEYLKESILEKEFTGCWAESGLMSSSLWSSGLLHRLGRKAIAAHPTASFGLDGLD
jgi:hypothetical protein